MENNTILNKEFRVKVSGNGYHQLVGWPMLVDLIGEELAERYLLRALSSPKDKYSVKLRRGLRIDFYSK